MNLQAPLPESALHSFVADLLRVQALPNVLWMHIPNGEHRLASVGRKLKAMGVRPGAADFAFVLPPHGKAAFLELKAKGKKPRATQVQFGSDTLAAGGLYQWADSPELAAQILWGWGVIKRPSFLADADDFQTIGAAANRVLSKLAPK